VELRDATGQTFWSYLVTPGANAEDVSKDLAKRIAKHVSEALAEGDPPLRVASPPSAPTILRGAGATFPYPVYEKWITNYRRANPGSEINYEPIGSEAGVRKLIAGEIDFGASDTSDVIRELAPGEQRKYLLFPTLVGAVVPIVNLPGLGSEIAFTPEALAGIYLGTIKNWNDPVLRRANPGLRLPDLDIVVIHRADGSGTSYAFTDYLSKTNPEWKLQVGASLAPEWPTGKAANGNDGMAQMVKELGGSIGYVEFIYALQNHLSFGKVRNRDGEFVSASLESMALAAREGAEVSDDFKVSITDAAGAGTYPIATFSWIVVPAHIADVAKRAAIKDFLSWVLRSGQAEAAALGYLALPKTLVAREEAAIVRID
jgi:phosphate transport system substrate-binding protein